MKNDFVSASPQPGAAFTAGVKQAAPLEAKLRRMDAMEQELGRRFDAVGEQRKRLRADIGQVRADYLLDALFPFRGKSEP